MRFLLAIFLIATTLASEDIKDCVVYKASGSNFEQFKYVTFRDKLRLGFIVRTNAEWTAEMVLRQKHGQNYCIVNIRGKENAQELTSKCSNSMASARMAELNIDDQKVSVNYLKSSAWNYLDLVRKTDHNGKENIYILSSDIHKDVLLFIGDTNLEGDLEVRWMTHEFDMAYNFNCYSGCSLDTGSSFFRANHPSGIMFYLWRDSELSNVRFKYVTKWISLPTSVSKLDGNNHWIKVRRNGSSFQWAPLDSEEWQLVAWPLGAKAHFESYGFEVILSAGTLITRCHPYHLRCPEINNCNTPQEYGMVFYILIASGYVVLTLIIVALVIYVRISKENRGQASVSMNDKVTFKCAENQYKQSPRNFRPSVEIDEFSSDHVYEDPMESLNLNTSQYNRSCGGSSTYQN